MHALRIHAYWRYLPVLRLVAECGGVREAAGALKIAPSAVTRSLAILREHVGADLFTTEKKLLRLTRLGESLVATTRESMRTIDDIVASLSNNANPTNSLTQACEDFTFESLASSAAASLSTFANTSVRCVPQNAMRTQLLNGSLDACWSANSLQSKDIESTLIGKLRYGVYRHPKVKTANAKLRYIVAADLSDAAVIHSVPQPKVAGFASSIFSAYALADAMRVGVAAPIHRFGPSDWILDSHFTTEKAVYLSLRNQFPQAWHAKLLQAARQSALL